MSGIDLVMLFAIILSVRLGFRLIKLYKNFKSGKNGKPGPGKEEQDPASSTD